MKTIGDLRNALLEARVDVAIEQRKGIFSAVLYNRDGNEIVRGESKELELALDVALKALAGDDE